MRSSWWGKAGQPWKLVEHDLVWSSVRSLGNEVVGRLAVAQGWFNASLQSLQIVVCIDVIRLV
jgi:hypothetical protein